VTLLERAHGTMDELLEEEDEDDEMTKTKDARWGAWLFQVIAALTTAQYYYGFVHNDLHSNNIMWSTTDKPYLYYRVHKKSGAPYILRVPTYGKLMKIIDFGRATYHLPDPAGFFIPDAFFPGNDASTQYNCEPFYDAKEGARVEPNPSFDLSRLSVALLEFLYPDRPEAAKPIKIMSKEGNKLYSETVSRVYNMLWEWLIDDSGANILRLPSGKERYPDFDLYRAIAAEIHRAVPRHQIERPLYQEYKFTDAVPSDEPVYDLHI
jgi:serine/threonine protein kinase